MTMVSLSITRGLPAMDSGSAAGEASNSSNRSLAIDAYESTALEPVERSK